MKFVYRHEKRIAEHPESSRSKDSTAFEKSITLDRSACLPAPRPKPPNFALLQVRRQKSRDAVSQSRRHFSAVNFLKCHLMGGGDFCSNEFLQSLG